MTRSTARPCVARWLPPPPPRMMFLLCSAPTLRSRAMDHTSLRTQLVFAVGYIAGRSRSLLRRIVKEHTPDDAERMFGERVVAHLEQSGFEIDEGEGTIRKRSPTRPHG